MELNMKFVHKKVGVVGLGKTGISTFKFLKNHGAEVILWDDNNLSREKLVDYGISSDYLVEPNNLLWKELDYLIMSPGIPLTFPNPHYLVSVAKSYDCPIITDVELLYLTNSSANFIGITGTNGKSTTSALINHIFSSYFPRVQFGGNIGNPVLDLEAVGDDGWYILEMSSFQLDLIDKTRFKIAVLLNLTPDHLDRHGNMENYLLAKKRIFARQQKDDVAVIAIDNDVTKKVYQQLSLEKKSNIIPVSASKVLEEGISVIKDQIYYKGVIYDIGELDNLRGVHNCENMASAIAVSIAAGIPISHIIPAIKSFKSLKHRMQYLGEINGIKFINDSKATNAESTSKALASYDNIWWIVGGRAKEGGIESLVKYFPKVKKALLIGESEEIFANFLSNKKIPFKKCQTVQKAYDYAVSNAVLGDVILLSPACASYDQWKNFEERGDYFCNLVKPIA